jgi:uncharacterized protein (DUF1697 family)
MDRPMTASVPAQQSEEITVACHEREIPSFVESELERLYGHIYSSLAFFRLFKPPHNVSTYVARRGGRATAVLVFRCENGKVEVFNEMIRIDEEEIGRFAEYIFARFPSVSVISFQAIQTAVQTLPFPCQQYNEKEEFAIMLPATPDEYTASLGKATRSNIKRYTRRLAQNFPSFTHRTYENEEVDEQHVRDIINISKVRMTGKKKKFSVDETMTEGLVRLAKACGFVNVVMVDDRLCAGSISYRIGSNYFAFVNAHDAEFDSYWLGTLCYYFTICESILRGGKQLHMGWGRYDYKSRLLGVQQDFDSLVIYRSYAHVILNCGSVVKTAVKGHLRRLKLWLQDPQRQNSVMSRAAVNLIFVLRKVRGN